MDGDSDKTIDSDELEELKNSQKKSRSSLSSSEKKSPVKGSKKNLGQNCLSDSASSDGSLKKKKQSHNNSDTDKTIDSDELENFIASSQKIADSVSESDKKRLKLEKMSDSDEEVFKKSVKSMSNKPSKRALPMRSLGLWSDSDSEKEINTKKKVKERVSRKKSKPVSEKISDSDSCSENIMDNKCKTALTEKSQSNQIKSLGLWSDSENEREGEENENISVAKSNTKFKSITSSSIGYGVSKNKTNISSGPITKFDSEKDFQNNSNAIFPSTSKVSNSEKFKQSNLNTKQSSSYNKISDSDSEEKIINTDKSNERALGKRTHSKFKEISDSDSDNEVVRKKANTSAGSNTVAKEKKTNKNVSSQPSRSRHQELSDSDNEAVPNNIQIGSKQDLGRKKEKCWYGKNCYRKNPDHIKNFDHGSDADISDVKNGDKKIKKCKISPSGRQNFSNENLRSSPSTSKGESSKEKLEFRNVNKPASPESKIFGFYLTKVNGIPQKYNAMAYDIKDLLSFNDGTLISSAQFNYMFDVPWLVQQYPENYRKCPLTIVHGEQKQSKAQLEKTCLAYPNIKLCQAKLDIPFGTHHTKMMFLLYKEGFRIIIHTSNIVDNDWDERSQGMWVSPLLPELKNPSITEGDSPTNFKKDLLEYVSAYNASGLDEWLEVIKKHNFSSVRVVLIGSVPGRYMGPRVYSFGHLKLRKVLIAHGSSMNLVLPTWPIVCQFSSIGSLGTKPDQWLTSEFCSSLSMVQNSTLSCQTNIKLVFPTVENVRKSLQGYPSGASLPYSIKVAQKQPYLRDFMHSWKSDRLGRSEASPHIKTYFRLSPDNSSIPWFLLTSANLSKAAWGCNEKKGSVYMIRSYELGVLFLPKFFELEVFSTPFSTKKDDASIFPIPYDIPLERYSKDDEIWTWDIPHVHAPDRHGMKWCPPGLK